MREYILEINPSMLSGGLRPDCRMPRNTFSLYECRNCKVIENFGIVPYDPVRIPFSQSYLDAHGIYLDWPYPQLFKGTDKTILATGDRLFFVDAGWQLIEMDLYDVHAPSNLRAVTKTGRPWQFIDCHDTWFMVNGGGSVFHTSHRGMPASAINDRVLVETNTPINAGCHYKGRILLGGFDPEKFWNTDLVSTFEAVANRGGTGIRNKLDGLNRNFILWSSIGGGDVPLFLFLPSYSRSSFINADKYGTDRNLWFDLMKREEWGFMPMPFQNEIMTMKPLGDVVMVYGFDGICGVRHVSDPIPTIGLVPIPELSNVGIPCAGAVGGDSSMHLFVDNAGTLWRMDENLEVTRLGYREYLSDLLGNQIMISYDQDDREAWICGGYDTDGTYHLTSSGMSKVDQIVTSVIDDRLGLGQDAGDFDKRSVITFDTIDFGNRGMKLLQQIQLPVDLGSFDRLEMCIWWRNNTWENFKRTGWETVSSHGVAWPHVAGVDFRISFRFSDLKFARIEYLKISYKQIDKRFLRGVYVGTHAVENVS